MAEVDPFGRAKGEDPLAEMGWSTEGTVAPEARPTDVAAPERTRRGRRSNAGCAASVPVLGFIVVVFAIVVPNVLDASDTADEGGDRTPTPRVQVAPPQGLDARSMLRRGNLAPAVRDLRRVTEGIELGTLRVDAQSVQVSVLIPGNRMRIARTTWDGEPRVLATAAAGGVAGIAFPWQDADLSAPARIVRATTRGRPRSFDYAVLIEGAGLRWSAHLKDGTQFTASPDGREVTRVG